MPPENTIESLSVALTGDASQLARDVEMAMQHTIATMEASAEEIAAANEKIFDDLIEGIRKATDDPVFQQWQLQMEYFGKTAEDAAEFVSENLGIALDGVVEKVAAANNAVAELVEHQVQITTQRAGEGGIAFTEEETQRIREQIAEVYRAGDAYKGYTHTLKALNEIIENNRQVQIDTIAVEQMVAEAIAVTKAGYEQLGKSMPIEKTDQLDKRLRRLAKTTQEMGLPLKKARSEMLEIAENAVPKQTTAMSKLGQMIQGVAGKVIGLLGAYTLLKKVGQFLRESVEEARIAIEETIRLTLAVREHQRAVGELSPTIADANRQVDFLSDTYNLNRNATRRLVSESLLLTEALGMSNDETKSLQESSVILAEIMGKDALGVMKQLTNFLNTGYTQGLRDLGFQLDDHTLRVEAIKRGYIEYGQILDEQTMRMVGMEIIEERAIDAKEDLIASQDTIVGQLKDQNVELEKSKELLGKFIVPLWDGFKLVGVKALTAVTQLLTIVAIKLMEFFGNTIARMQAVADVVKAVQDLGFRGVVDEYGGIGKAYGAMFEKRSKEMSETVRDSISDVINAGTELGDEFGEGLDKAGRAAQEFEDTLVAAMDGAVTAIDKLSRKYEQDFIKLENRLTEQLNKIDEDFARRREKMGLDLARDLQDIERNSAQRRVEASRDFYNTEERERADHQLAMKRMEADYLMSLEDAVHERDARQVLSLRRKFTQDKKRANEDYSIAKKRRRQDFQLELAEIEQQRIIRRNKRIEQFNQETVELAEQEELKRKQARDAFNQRIEELNARYNEMLRLEAEKLAQSLNLNAEHLEALAKMLDQAYGSNGFVVAYVSGISEWLSQQNLLLPGIETSYGTFQPPADALSTAPITATGRLGGITMRQRGGTMFASSPTLVEVGHGPERVDFTRLSQPGGGPRGGGAGAGGPIEIGLRVAMEDGLIAEITDQTMEDVAKVFVSIEGGGPRTAGRR